MDNKIEDLIKLSGNQHKYQYINLILSFVFWLNICCISVSIPLLEKPPDAKYVNEKNQTVIEPITYEICENYDYLIIPSPHLSWVNDLEIYCNRTKVGLIGSFAFVGFTTGALIYPIVTKFLTHKPVIIITTLIYIVFVFSCTIFTTNYWALIILLIGITLFSNISSYSILILVEESVSTNKRVLFGNIVNIGFSFSGVVYVMIFYFFKNWLYVFYCGIGCNFLLTVIFFLFAYDSPRGFIARKDIGKTLDILRGIAKFNNKLEEFEEEIKKEDYLNTLKMLSEEDNDKRQDDIEDKIKEKFELKKENSVLPIRKEKITGFSLIKYASIRVQFLSLCLLFFFTYGVYNGIVIGAKNISGNFYINIILLYLMEALSFLITGFLTNIPFLGRKKTIFIWYLIASVSMLVLYFFNMHSNYQLIFFLIARFCVSGAVTTYYTYSLENYPTPVRTLGFGINATMGNLGGIVSSLLIEYISKKNILLCNSGVLILCSSILMLFLKETVGLPMQESIDEMNTNRLIDEKDTTQ